MKRKTLFLPLLLAFALSACSALPPAADSPDLNAPASETQAVEVPAEAEVRALVEGFGQRLQMVSLLSPTAAQDIQAQYGKYVSPALLESWAKNVQHAPGRIVSSPWPDRIEITAVERQAEDLYVINGFIIEVTSTEAGSGGAANKIPVRIVVARSQGRWLITAFAEER